MPKSLIKKVNGYKMSKPFVNVYMGLDIDLSKQMPVTNFFSMPSTANIEVMFDKLVDNGASLPSGQWLSETSQHMPGFIHCGSIKDPTNRHHAPEGCSSLESMCIVPSERHFWTQAKLGEDYGRDPYYLDLKAQMTEIMVDRAESVLPGIKQHIVWKEAATPLTQGRFTQSTDFTAYGLECNIKQFGPFRPRSRTAIHGLFLAGTSTTWGPSIEGSVCSGMQAAAAVLGRDLDSEIRAGKVYGDPSRLTSGGVGWDPLKASTALGKPAKSQQPLTMARD